jgi:hypothetical protein
MKPLPIVTQAEYRGEYKIWVAFSDGVVGTVDCSDWLKGPMFEPLHDTTFFARLFIDGGTVVWPNGADISPEALHRRAKTSRAA